MEKLNSNLRLQGFHQLSSIRQENKPLEVRVERLTSDSIYNGIAKLDFKRFIFKTFKEKWQNLKIKIRNF